MNEPEIHGTSIIFGLSIGLLIFVIRFFAHAMRGAFKSVPGPDHPGTVKRPDRQNSAAILPPTSREGLTGPKRSRS